MRINKFTPFLPLRPQARFGIFGKMFIPSINVVRPSMKSGSREPPLKEPGTTMVVPENDNGGSRERQW